MDRSVLSDPAVVAASRDFICARLLTYESAEEGEFLESIFRGRTGELENTVFTLLAPDGKTMLTRAGRSPNQVFRGPPGESTREMVQTMKRLAAQHAGDASVARRIPYLADLRRGLNVAACDLLPLVIVAAQGKESREKVESVLAPLAWNAPYIGKFEYAPVSAFEELKSVEGASAREGIIVVEPDAYGLKGKVLSQSSGVGSDDFQKALDGALKAFVPRSKDSRKHIEEGRRAGVHWETAIPVTDPGPPGGRR